MRWKQPIIQHSAAELLQMPQVSYTTNDHLGSPRINTDAAGNVISRHDYRPFGEEIERAGYAMDDVRKQFTGYERDRETDLDFAQARMYSKNHGRFTTPDNVLNDAERIAPQSWNLYIYTRNNPHKYVDTNGTNIWIYYEEKDENNKTVKRRVQYKDGKVYDGDKEYTGNNAFVKNVLKDLNALHAAGGELQRRLGVLAGDKHDHNIETYTGSKNIRGGSTYWENGNTLTSYNAKKGEALEAGEGITGTAPTAVTLARTLLGTAYNDTHDDNDETNVRDFLSDNGSLMQFSYPEADRIDMERAAREHFGVPRRESFNGESIPNSVTADAFRSSNYGRSTGGGISVTPQDDPDDPPPPVTSNPVNRRP